MELPENLKIKRDEQREIWVKSFALYGFNQAPTNEDLQNLGRIPWNEGFESCYKELEPLIEALKRLKHKEGIATLNEVSMVADYALKKVGIE